MAFIDSFKKNVSDVASATAKKTSELTDTAKIKFKIKKIESRLDRCYSEIGRLRYDELKEGADYEIKISTLIMQIDKLRGDLTSANAELLNLKRVSVCPVCKAEISKDCLHCPICGEKLSNDSE